MFRKLIVLLLTLFFMGLIIFTAMMFLKNEETLYTYEDIELGIDKPTFITIGDAQSETDGALMIKAHPLTFLGLSIGSLTITEETLPNGDILLFEQITNTGWMPFTMSVNRKGLADAEIVRWNEDIMPQQEESRFGTDATRNPYGTIRTGTTETVQGNMYVSRQLTLGNGETVQELRHEIYDFPMEDGELSRSFWLPPKHQSESWMLISSEELFDSAETEREWIEFANANRRDQFNWLTPDGPRQKIELTEDLRTELAYSVPATQKSAYAEWQEQTASRYFESMNYHLTD